MRIFTRTEFHALVWSRPMTQLAKEFALSDVALHKICKKHGIPNPPPGWWAKKAAGRKVTQTPLPKAAEGVADRIVIAGGELRREPEAVAAVREQARVLASAAVPEESLHPVIDRTIAKLRKAKPGPTDLVVVDGKGLIKCQIAPASVDRVAAALGPILAAAAQQGFRLDAGEGSASFAGADETVAFSISETVKRVTHALTEKEQAEQEKWQRKMERARSIGDWRFSFSRPRFDEWDYHTTGQLSFEFEHIYVWSGSSPRRSFRDAKVQRLETMAGDIAVGLAVLAATKTAQRLHREAEQQRAEEQRRLREQNLRLQHVEERRISVLESILAELDQVERIRRLLNALREGSRETTDSRVAEFVRWSELHLAQQASELKSEGLERRFQDQQLFGEDDDHAFRPPAWY